MVHRKAEINPNAKSTIAFRRACISPVNYKEGRPFSICCKQDYAPLFCVIQAGWKLKGFLALHKDQKWSIVLVWKMGGKAFAFFPCIRALAFPRRGMSHECI